MIRRATAADAAAVAEVWLLSRKASVPAIPPPVHDDADVRLFFAQVVIPERDTWVIDLDGEVVALLALEGGWVDHLYVRPDHVGHGLGSELLALAKRQRPDGLDLWTFQSNVGARRFYERHGFTAVAMTDGDNEEGEPDVHYRWPSSLAATADPT